MAKKSAMTHKVSENINRNPTVVLNQLKDLIKIHVSFNLKSSLSDPGFFGHVDDFSKSSGILSVKTSITHDDQILVTLGIIKLIEEPVSPYRGLLDHLSNLGEKVWLQQSEKDFYEIAFKVDPAPLGITRMEGLKQKIEEVIAISKFLQQTVVHPGEDFVKLAEKYKNIKTLLSPVYPMNERIEVGSTIESKVSEVIGFIESGICVAITSIQKLSMDFFLSAMSGALKFHGKTIGNYIENSLLLKGVPELINKAPGTVVVPSIVLSFGTNAYDRASEIDALLAILSKNGSPLLFTGNYAEHQSVFGSGQGHQAQPLQPAIIHIKYGDIPIESLIDFAIDREISSKPAISKPDIEKLKTNILGLFQSGELNFENLDIIVSIVRRKFTGVELNVEQIFKIFKSQKETFRGLNTGRKQFRDESIQQNFFNGMQAGKFPEFLKKNLVGQEEALEEATERLWTEFLTRPLNQPIRMILQGIPGVGKSEFSQCVADYFNIPQVSIDTASLQSHHEASSLLLGSGRGIVQSYMPGKLETMAKHHESCVVEVADLDHCEPGVRGFIADLFLHILQTGYAQTATGETISCANLIIIFTINLPGGKDESVLKGLGFNSEINSEEIKSRTLKEMKAMFSSAFVSRIGNPILFKPFCMDEKVAIMEIALEKSLHTSIQNLRAPIGEISIPSGIGNVFSSQIEMIDQGLGARGIYDLARKIVTELVSENFDKIKNSSTDVLKLSLNKSNQIIINL